MTFHTSRFLYARLEIENASKRKFKSDKMKNAFIVLALSISFISCEKQFLDLPGKHGDRVTTGELTFRDMGMCSDMWFENDCGDIFEVYNYFPQDMGFCGTPYMLQPGERVSLTYQCYDDSELVQCEALSVFEQECFEKGKRIRTVEVVHDVVAFEE
ncbi:hypothetical protein N8Z73_01485 [bacterium]|nr:hypothetical protein [bacterium]